ncbi:hypothetical protein [Clostridium sp. HBUAS56010]|uniref:hypothetical protein n=1 Tax=Clostridium sp. HBUAS56010 TaxID=2571127 RepID=UPI001178945F|nr:hypothetical protein [Clostridium sp. HBUAS56010]
MKKFNIATYVLIAILVFAFIPMGIAFLVSFNFINTDTSNEWIGFWGGYLGSIIGGAITLYVLFKTLLDGKKLQKREEKLKYCDQIVEVTAEYNRKVSLLLMRIIDFHIALSSKKPNGLEELFGYIYGMEKSKFILTVMLYSNEMDEEYERIEEIKNIVGRIQSLLEIVTKPVIDGTIAELTGKVFDEVSKKVNEEQEKLLEETINFLVANKRKK